MKKKRILFFMQMPPPIYGVTLVNKIVYESPIVQKNIIKKLLKIEYSQTLSDLNKLTFKKIYLLAKHWFLLLFNLISFRPHYVYYTIPPTGVGFYKEIPNLFLLKIFKTKPIFHLHGKGIEDKVKNNFQKKIYQWAFSNSVIIHLSKGLIKSELKNLKLNNTHLFSVPNGVEEVNISTQKNNKDINLLFLSNIQESKGFFLLLEVFHQLTQTNSSLKLHIIGNFRDNSSLNKYKHFIEEKNISSYIELHGALYGKEKHHIINQCDILIHPSFNDAFPLVILEAMQHGLAIIGSDQGAIPEIITKDIGYVIKTGDKNDLYQQLLSLITNNKLRAQMQTNAKELYKQKYTQECFEYRIQNVLDKL